MYHSTFRLGGIPIFYFPWVQHPVDRLGRQTGFLIPTIGQSSTKGTILGEGIYWAINREMDATIGAEYFSHRGWAQHGSFRARPTDNSYFNVTYFGVLDRGTGTPKVDQGGEDVRANGEIQLPHGFRAVADIDYLSSFVFRLAFAETFTLAVNSEVRSNAFLSKAYNGYFFNLDFARYQNFESTQRGDLVTILHAPALDLSSVDHQLGRSPFYWSYDAAVQGVSRREPQFVTAPLVGRVDVEPRLAMPLLPAAGASGPRLAVRDTYYTQRLAPSGVPSSGIGAILDADVNRHAIETSLEVRPPSLSRIFQKTGEGPHPQAHHRAARRLSLRRRRGQSSRHHPLRRARHPQQHQRDRIRRRPAPVRQGDQVHRVHQLRRSGSPSRRRWQCRCPPRRT